MSLLRKMLFILPASLVFAVTGWAQTAAFEGTVKGADGKPQVKRLTLAADQTGEWTVPLSQLGNAVLVLSALARTTTEPAPYQLRISE